MPDFKPIKQTRASEEVLSQLKEAILRGQVKPGGKLPSERELTEQFQVSRGVVREAIRVLEMTGFVTMRQGPAGGAYVTDLDFSHVSSGFLDLYLANKLSIPELNQVRQYIEPEVARLAAERITPEYKRRLEDAMAAERGTTSDIEERMHKLTDIHFILAEMCGNYLFEAIVNAMISLTHQIVKAVKREGHEVLHAVGEHDDVARAVIAGDPEAASRAMAAHLDKYCRALILMDQEYKGFQASSLSA